jgi:hypothetical protein
MNKWITTNTTTAVLLIIGALMIWHNVSGYGWVLFWAFVNYKDYKKC